MKTPVQVAVTGAAGQISYALLFRLIAGELTGPDQPIILRLLELKEALPTVEGLVMELEDCASPLLAGVVITDDPMVAFAEVDYAFLLGARPRGPGMERQDLLQVNGQIFGPQGRALDAVAKRSVKVLVVGNPANTNALIAQRNAPGLSSRNFSAMTRLDQNRGKSLLAKQAGCDTTEVKQVSVWGNHSSTQYPDIYHALVRGQPALTRVEESWFHKTFIPTVRQRGAAIISARGKSSAASAAHAALDHMRDWINGTPEDDWVSMGVLSDGSYDIAEGLIYSFPVRIQNGDWRIVQDLPINEFCRAQLTISEQELVQEREMVKHLL